MFALGMNPQVREQYSMERQAQLLTSTKLLEKQLRVLELSQEKSNVIGTAQIKNDLLNMSMGQDFSKSNSFDTPTKQNDVIDDGNNIISLDVLFSPKQNIRMGTFGTPSDGGSSGSLSSPVNLTRQLLRWRHSSTSDNSNINNQQHADSMRETSTKNSSDVKIKKSTLSKEVCKWKLLFMMLCNHAY